MAKIELRPCRNQWEDDADYIEIPVNETNVLIIRKEYGYTGDKRFETLYIAHKKQIDGDWKEVAETSYVCF